MRLAVRVEYVSLRDKPAEFGVIGSTGDVIARLRNGEQTNAENREPNAAPEKVEDIQLPTANATGCWLLVVGCWLLSLENIFHFVFS
jgi:hypothetical protein